MDKVSGMQRVREDETAIRFTMRMCSEIEDKENHSLSDSLPTSQSIIDYVAVLAAYDAENMGSILERLDEGASKIMLYSFIAKHDLKWFIDNTTSGYVMRTYTDKGYKELMAQQPLCYA